MKKQGIFKATGINFLAKAGASILGFAQFILIAKIFGIGIETDAYLIGQTLPMLFSTIGSIVFGYTLLPVFIEYMEKGREEEAWIIADVFFTIIALVTLVFSIASFIFAPYLVSILAPGFSGEGVSLTVSIIRLMSPAFFLIGVSSINATLITGFRHFTVPAVASTFIGVGGVSSILLFTDSLGIMAVPAGLMAGLTAETIVLYLFMTRKRALRPSLRFSAPGVAQVFRLMGPRLITIVLNRIARIVDRLLASSLGAGVLSALIYADKITHAICLVPPLALTKSMFPDLVKHFATGDKEKVRDLLMKAIRFICFIFLPVTVVVFVSGESIVTMFFKRGAFDAHAVSNTVIALRFFTLGMLALALNAVMRSAFFSMQDSATPLKIGILSFTVNITFDLIFIRIFGFGGIALSSSLAAVINAIVMYRLLLKKNVFDAVSERLGPFLRKLFIASFSMGGLMWAMEVFVKGVIVADHGKGRLGLFFIANIVLGLIVYMAICVALRVREYKSLLKILAMICKRGGKFAHFSI